MVLILEARSHLDLGDLPNLLAAELGVMTVRLERAIRSLDEVAQVHVNRWGDGAAHLHLWFLGRPAGQLQLRGPFLAMWMEILDPVPDAQWRRNLAHIAAWLEEFGGAAQVAPPRIEWHAPSTFAGIAALADPAMDAALGAGVVGVGVSVEAAGGEGADGSSAAKAMQPAPNVGAPTDDPSSAAERGGDGHIHTSAVAGSPDWTTVDYGESDGTRSEGTRFDDAGSEGTPSDNALFDNAGSDNTRASGDVTDGQPILDLASDDSETVSVRIPSQAKRPREERVGR